MSSYQVLFLPSLKKINGKSGMTILDLAREAGVSIDSQCGGIGMCGKCRVRLLEGKINSFTEEESLFISHLEKELGYRLACMTHIKGDATVLIPGEDFLSSRATKKLFSKRSKVINPAVKSYAIDLDTNETDYIQPIMEELRKKYCLPHITIDTLVLQNLEKESRKDNDEITVCVWMDKEVIAVHRGGDRRCLGVALDIGTTTLALYLCDLVKGDVIASGSMTNPQVLFGADIMSRIAYSVDHPVEGVRRMQRELIKSVNVLIDAIVSGKGYSPRQVMDMTVVGNTVMHHIFLGIPPDGLGFWPFEPSVKESVNVKAYELGLLINPCSYVHVLPVEAGFIGADNVGVLISEEPYNRDAVSLTIDIGTNGEIVLGNREKLLSCSCATGPALEGAEISCGMRALPGAIEKILIDPETLEVDYVMIGNKKWASEQTRRKMLPLGVCGSGIIDAVAYLYRTGVIKTNGAFSSGVNTRRLRKGESGVTEFVLVWGQETATGKDIVITQKDIRQVQLAKAALNVGCKVLMGHLKVNVINRMTIAGAFGMNVDKESALAIGFFPRCKPENITMVGNAAGHGAYLALIDRGKREEADNIAPRVIHIELTMEDGFQEEFIKALAIP